jgi:hypothetical protein
MVMAVEPQNYITVRCGFTTPKFLRCTVPISSRHVAQTADRAYFVDVGRGRWALSLTFYMHHHHHFRLVFWM